MNVESSYFLTLLSTAWQIEWMSSLTIPCITSGWICQPNDDDSINTSPLGIVCESPCSTYFYNECDTDDGYCYLDYTGSDGSSYVYEPKCA